jgi:hypothetical protein
LDVEDPLDAAVFACLATRLYATAGPWEFTIWTLQTFNPNAHITNPEPITRSGPQRPQSDRATPSQNKTAGNEGEDTYSVSQEGEASQLFVYRVNHARKPLTKAKSLEMVEKTARAAGREHMQGHGIRIRLTPEYLLRGDVMKANGRWAGESSLRYLQNTQLPSRRIAKPSWRA